MMTWHPSILLLALVLTGGAARAAMPEDVSGAVWFGHCQRLGVDRVSQYPDVMNHKITYAWASDLGYRWDWENGVRASVAAHYCVRMALYLKRGHMVENVTFLCSVTDRGKRTEVWMFGNAEVAKSLCPMGGEELAQMDARGRQP